MFPELNAHFDYFVENRQKPFSSWKIENNSEYYKLSGKYRSQLVDHSFHFSVEAYKNGSRVSLTWKDTTVKYDQCLLRQCLTEAFEEQSNNILKDGYIGGQLSDIERMIIMLQQPCNDFDKEKSYIDERGETINFLVGVSLPVANFLFRPTPYLQQFELRAESDRRVYKLFQTIVETGLELVHQEGLNWEDPPHHLWKEYVMTSRKLAQRFSYMLTAIDNIHFSLKLQQQLCTNKPKKDFGFKK